MFAKTFSVAIVASLMASVNAHLAIQQPPPIPGSDSKSPLDPSGSNFPCQGASLTGGGTVTSMAAGSVQPLQFNLGAGANTAVHGGGSCQVSITYETDPAKVKNPANWKVLHSWLGGCPTNAMGNLQTAVACSGSSTDCVQSFTFTVPQEVKAGTATLAWTWFNNIGNREMYMNCAKVSITGGNGNVDSLPGLFAANIGNGCSTTEQFNTDFPNPGQYVTKDSTLNYPLKAGVGSCGSGSGSAGTPSTTTSGSSGSSGSSASSGSKSGSSGSAVASAAASAAAPATSASTGKGRKGSGTFAEGAGTTLVPVAAAPSSIPEAASTGAATGASSAASGAVACSSSGFYCISATTFGLCDNGFAVPMPVAAGTTCTGGAIAAVRRRHLKIRHAHHRRHFFESHL